MVDGYNIGARNQHANSGAYEFHIHRAYIIYDPYLMTMHESTIQHNNIVYTTLCSFVFNH